MMTYTVAEAERILAEAKAREAVVDPWEDAVTRYMEFADVPRADRHAVKRGLIAALPLAPIQPAPAPSEEDDLRLAREAVHSVTPWADPYQIALAAIRAERKRAGGVRWPSDAELREMAEDVGDTLEPALEMARRPRAYQTGGEAYGKVHTDGSRSGGQPVAEPEWIDWHGGECPVPAGTRVEVELPSGDTIEATAGNLEWRFTDENMGCFDPIRRYRILGEQP